MLQTVDGLKVYVVNFDTMPELPITWNNSKEKPYAQALQAAIQNGIITEPGKYGIHIELHFDLFYTYTINRIIE